MARSHTCLNLAHVKVIFHRLSVVGVSRLINEKYINYEKVRIWNLKSGLLVPLYQVY